MTTELLTEPEAAAILHISARTLRLIRSRGMIRYVRPSPRKVFYRADDLADYIDRHTFQNKPQQPTTNVRKARTAASGGGSSDTSGKAPCIMDLLAARPGGMPKGLKPITGLK